MWKKAKFLIKETHLRIKYMKAKDCIFCKIIAGEIKTELIAQSDKVIAFNDVNPISAVHILIVPKRHIESVLKISEDDAFILVAMHQMAQKIIKDKNLTAFRLAFNGGSYQHVGHLHMHLLAGGSVQWSKL